MHESYMQSLTIEQLRAEYTVTARAMNAILAEVARRQANAAQAVKTATEDNSSKFCVEHDTYEPCAHSTPVAGKALTPVTEAGMYLMDGEIYKVQAAVHGSGHLYAKKLTLHGEGEKATFEFSQGTIKKLRAEWKMTLEQAKEFGALYGTCCVCGKTLTDENSIAAGIGPVCAGKGMWA